MSFRGNVEAQTQQLRAMTRAIAVAKVRARAAKAEARAGVVEEAGERAVARAKALVRVLRQVEGLMPVLAPAEELEQEYTNTSATYTFRYDEFLADSKLRNILYSIHPDHRQSFARELSLRSSTLHEYWWFIQISTPITRIPTELLQQILFIIIHLWC